MPLQAPFRTTRYTGWQRPRPRPSALIWQDFVDLGRSIGEHEFGQCRRVAHSAEYERADDLSARDVLECACPSHQVGNEQFEANVDRPRCEHLQLDVVEHREIGSEINALRSHLVRSIKYF
jgi:hypothetical protein